MDEILLLNGIYDIVCSVSILYFPLSIFGQLHIGMIMVVPLCSDIAIIEFTNRFIAYWIFGYGLIRFFAGLCKTDSLYGLAIISYLMETFVFCNESIVYKTMDKQKTIFVATTSMIIALYIFYFISIKYIMPPPNSPVQFPKYTYTPLAKLTARANKRSNRVHRFGAKMAIVQLPPVLSLEPYRNFTYDQGELGSCTANAFCGAYRIMCAINKVNQSFEPSRLFFYYQERLIEGTPEEDSGADVIDGESYVMTNGICSERLCPYNVSLFTKEPSKEAYAEAMSYKISTYAVLDNGPLSNILNEIKMAINNEQPVLIAIAIYSSFESLSVANTGHVPIPDTNNEECLGGHEMCLIGYNDESQCFTVMNSWGDKWGNGGLCYIPYGYLGNRDLGQEFTIFQL